MNRLHYGDGHYAGYLGFDYRQSLQIIHYRRFNPKTGQAELIAVPCHPSQKVKKTYKIKSKTYWLM